jgi:hypothetical protein
VLFEDVPFIGVKPHAIAAVAVIKREIYSVPDFELGQDSPAGWANLRFLDVAWLVRNVSKFCS